MNQATQPVRGRGTVLTAVAIAVAVVASLAFASMAAAAANPVAAGGKTTLTLNSGFTNLLKKDKVKLTGTSPATVKGKTVTLPIEEGKLDIAGAGELTHAGGLKFKAGKKSVTVSALVLTPRPARSARRSAASTMKFAAVSGLSAARNGFGTNVTIASLKLTSKAAKELNKKLGLNAKQEEEEGQARLDQQEEGRAAQAPQGQPGPRRLAQRNAAEDDRRHATGSRDAQHRPGFGDQIERSQRQTGSRSPRRRCSAPLPPVAQLPDGAGGTISPDGKQGSVRTNGGLLLNQEPSAFPGKETKMTLGNIWVELSTGRATVEVIVDIDGRNRAMANRPTSATSAAPRSRPST